MDKTEQKNGFSSEEAHTRGIFSAEAANALSSPNNKQETYELAFNMSVHKNINNSVVGPVLSDQALFAFNYGNISQDASSATTGKMDHHFCNDELSQSLKYADSVASQIKSELGKPKLTDEDLLRIVKEEGAMMHTLQDFYAHSNYTELNLQNNPKQKLGEIPLVNWDEIRTGKAKDLHTGFYYYKDGAQNELANKMTREEIIAGLALQNEKIPGTKYLDDFLYDRDREKGFAGALHIANEKRYTVLHEDTAKDDPDHPQGKIKNPYTGNSLFEYARDLGTRETYRQWSSFEDTVHQLRGKDDGDKILNRIKNLSVEVQKQNWYHAFPEGWATEHATAIS